MNRIIKFRVWDIKRKLFYGPHHIDNMINKSKLQYLYSDEPDLIYQQFTGLKDKNNKEIYEGDFIIFMGRWDENGKVLKPDYQTYEVLWEMGGLWAHTIKRTVRSFHLHNELLGVGHTDSKIIGNILENPELNDCYN